MSDLALARNNAAWLECFPEKPSWNEQVCQGGKSVKRFFTERTKKRKKRQLVILPPPGGATGTVV